MNKKLDDILYDSLSPIYEPDPELNRRIIEAQSKEVFLMKHIHFRKTAAAVAACVIAVGGLTAYAAYRYLSPSQIADELSDNNALTKAFESSDAISVNETQTSGDYDITFLGLVSGSGLSPYIDAEQTGALKDSQTYAAFAVSRNDGTAMEEENKCISPLINGVDWMTANNATLNAGLHWFDKEGVIYELLECDNLEIFAKRGVQIGVVDSFGNESSAFSMDDKTGVYKKNNDYTGTCALFTLPLDTAKADEKAADDYIKKLMTSKDEDEEADENDAEKTPEEKECDAFLERFHNAKDQMAFLKKNAVLIEGSRKTLKMDDEGLVEFGNEDDTNGTLYVQEQKIGVPNAGCITGGETLSDMVIHMFTLNEDKSVTYEEYTPALK